MKPSWLNGKLSANLLNDEADYLQWGQESEQTFFSFKMPPPLPSSWIYYPTEENPSNKFKFATIEINFNLDQMVWNRQTYALLDWLGDLGGLYDALQHICRVMIGPISAFTLNSSLLTSLFRLKERDSDIKDGNGRESQYDFKTGSK